jgi:hypothetical protein
MTEAIDVLEAARRLGVTPDAVRARLRRGTLEGYRDNSGNWRIVSNDTTADTTPEPVRHDTDTTRHDVVSPELARLLKALVERIETDQARLIEERDATRAETQEARADQVRMFDELRALADRHADRARLEAELDVRARTRIGSVPTILLNLSGFGMNWIAPARMPAYGVKRPIASAPVSPTCRPTPNIPSGRWHGSGPN